jgi:hypothetical protein
MTEDVDYDVEGWLCSMYILEVLNLIFKCCFAVAEWLKHSPAMQEVTGSRPTFGSIPDIYFSNRYILHGGTYNGMCGLQELAVTCNVRGDNWWKITLFQDRPL